MNDLKYRAMQRSDQKEPKMISRWGNRQNRLLNCKLKCAKKSSDSICDFFGFLIFRIKFDCFMIAPLARPIRASKRFWKLESIFMAEKFNDVSCPKLRQGQRLNNWFCLFPPSTLTSKVLRWIFAFFMILTSSHLIVKSFSTKRSRLKQFLANLLKENCGSWKFDRIDAWNRFYDSLHEEISWNKMMA